MISMIPVSRFNIPNATIRLALRLHDCPDVDLVLPAVSLGNILMLTKNRISGSPRTYTDYVDKRESIRCHLAVIERDDKEAIKKAAIGMLYLIFNIPGHADEIRRAALTGLETYGRYTITLACDHYIAYSMLFGLDVASEEMINASVKTANQSTVTEWRKFR